MTAPFQSLLAAFYALPYFSSKHGTCHCCQCSRRYDICVTYVHRLRLHQQLHIGLLPIAVLFCGMVTCQDMLQVACTVTGASTFHIGSISVIWLLRPLIAGNRLMLLQTSLPDPTVLYSTSYIKQPQQQEQLNMLQHTYCP